MIFHTSTKREASRIRTAVETMTGYQPSLFLVDGGGYRVQENEFGGYWAEALQALLDEGVKATDCTRERVTAKMEAMGL